MNSGSQILASREIQNNLRFIILEVSKQVEDTCQCLLKYNDPLIEKIYSREDYIDNLKSLIEKECFYKRFRSQSQLPKKELDAVRSLYIIANNLERIADFAVNIIGQLQYLNPIEFLHQYEFKEAFDQVLDGLNQVKSGFMGRDMKQGLNICKTEYNLDRFFSENMTTILDQLSTGKEAGNLVTTLFIFRYIERMGDSLLNIGEAVIFAVIGERIKIHQIESMQDTIGHENGSEQLTDFSIENILGTKSGCTISHIQNRNGNDPEQNVIFKEGRENKLRKEKEGIETWEKLQPGLPPKIYSFIKNKQNASMLIEFISGDTIQSALLTNKTKLLREGIGALKALLLNVWGKTRKEQPVNAEFMKQLSSRMKDIYRAHPEFNEETVVIGTLQSNPLDDLIQKVRTFEKDMSARFSVQIHGDLNLDNIIYNVEKQEIHLIDLHRTGQQDYVQDLSVFLISIFRLPVFVARLRDRMNALALDMLRFGRTFAAENKDETYDARMALGLSRSLITSTRFEFESKFVDTMYHRAIYLLKKLVRHQEECQPWRKFKLSDKIITY